MAIYKNVASQKLACYAYTASTGAAKTGDAAQITAYVSKDWAAGAAVTDTNPTELDSTNMPGWYVFDLAQAETNAEVLVFAPKSSTSGVVLDQVQVFTQDATISSRASQTSVDDVPTATENADALLKRDWTEVTGEAARSVLNALRFLRNKRAIATGTLTITKEDDSTSAWTAVVVGDAEASPITSIDPT